MRPRNRRRRISLTRKNEPTAFDAIDVEGVGEAFKNTEQLSSDGTTRRRATRVRALAVAMASPTPHRMALCGVGDAIATARARTRVARRRVVPSEDSCSVFLNASPTPSSFDVDRVECRRLVFSS